MNKGFTIVEILITMAIAVILIGFTTFSLLGLRFQTAMNTTVNSLSTDLRTQQLLTMTGEATTGAGIYFMTDSYVLFSGPAYNPASGANLTVRLNGGLVISRPRQYCLRPDPGRQRRQGLLR